MIEFTFQAYRNLLKFLQEKEYKFANYHNYAEFDKAVILRHDIDMDIEKALEISTLEYSLGISSTYYVLLSSDFYNVFSKKNELLLKQISSLGHDIGLHFDEEKYNDTSNIIKNIENEIEILEKCINRKVNSVSMHRPSKITLDADYKIKNGEIVNSYGKEFFEGFKYVSDSRRNWRENIYEIINSEKYKKLHILTHPIWYGKEEIKMKECLGDFISRAGQERYEGLKKNILNLEKVMGMDFENEK
ncbi:hypothetical protein [Anaerostipes sp.]|uniref:hypothetical protein n=1 Tax=Anaerostipes sp. TaxID=1872530 RepID=UPI0025C3DD1D|nr:hypothetical protein [Anaerostipes sp.]MBS7007122.1 hypothetical protein [Anaerostipes sp.]